MARRRERRLHETPIVRAVAAILDMGTPTRFAFEASCRHGIRASMCLDGAPWQRADDRAALIVTLALHRIGASTRPSWIDGQPEAQDTEHHWCAVCGGPVPETRSRYCGEDCRRIGKHRHRLDAMRADYAAHKLAFTAARSNGWPQSTCCGCGGQYAADPMHRRRYCSKQCFEASIRVDRTSTCKTCGETFTRSRHRTNRFCSRSCASKGQTRWRDRAGPPAT